MVTLKNNFGVEPDKDNPVMNASESAGSDAKSSVSGHPKAILNCRRNSHPFQTRTLILNTPAKIGRSVARARPNSYNGIFDCKVLSRNHAIIWYEYDAGKFMIQDTKSSNGTFVNNQRLSKGGETSLPREFFSRDVVQFGVDVLENQRKCNEESDNSDDGNHIVTHGCIVATVRLFHPNGKESKSGQPYATPDPITPIPQEQICKLKLIVYETQQREGRLHEKLEELQFIVSKLEVACQETLTNRFEETRLLSKIANLEKQTKVMSKAISGTGGKATEKFEAEIQQLLMDIEKLQTVAREIQERQHRKLLESEQKLIEAQRVATNFELEVIALREQASVTEKHIEEMGAKCTAHCQTIDILKSNYHAQVELNQKLEARMTKLDDRDRESESLSTFPELSSAMNKYKYITCEPDGGMNRKEKGKQEILLEKCKRLDESNEMEDKDFINEDDKTEWLTKKFDDIVDAMCSGLEHISKCIGQLEDALMDVEKSKKKVEKLCIRSQALSLELDTAKMSVENIEKTEKDCESEIFKPVALPLASNERITELETELEENEELLSQAKSKQRESEDRYTKLRSDLDANIKRCEKLIVDSCHLKIQLKNYFKCFEDNANSFKERITKLESEIGDMEKGQELKLLDLIGSLKKNAETKETQTISVSLATSSTNTDVSRGTHKMECSKKLKSGPELCCAEQQSPLLNFKESYIQETENLVSGFEEKEISDNFNTNKSTNEPCGNGGSVLKTHDLGTWEKIQKIQNVLSSQLSNETAISSFQIREIRTLMNLLVEDLVHLLLREQQITKDNQCLQRKLNKVFSQNDTEATVPAVHYRTVLLCLLIAIAAYLIYVGFL